MAAAGTSLLSTQKLRANMDGDIKPEYIRENIPAFEIPAYSGTRYEDRVPDTLDLAERARLGAHCMTSITDPLADHEIFFYVDLHRNPAVMVHDFNDWCRNVEGMYEALPLMRLVSGSDENSHVDQVWMEGLLKSIGPDGLVYYPLGGTAWARLRPSWQAPIWRADGTTSDVQDKSVSQITNPNLWPRAMAAMMIYHLRDRNPMWNETIERMIQGMSELFSDQGDYGYFPAGGFELNARFLKNTNVNMQARQVTPTGYLALDGGNGRMIQGLAQYYRLSGFEPARRLAKKIANFMRFHTDTFDEKGCFRFSAGEKLTAEHCVNYSRANGGNPTLEEIQALRLGGHFHSHGIVVIGLLEYATAINDKELLEWCKSSYEWMRAQGNSLTGFFPEIVALQYPSCEGCAVADMVGLAAKLSSAGVGDYWDDLDRWVRNQFAEMQLTDGQWIPALADTMPRKQVEFNETADGVETRNVGGFAGWASGNEWTLGGGIMHCCTGSATRSIYYAWENILHASDDELRVNLLLNRASNGADVYSFIPYEGRVSVKIKQPFGKVLLRVPEWVESGSIAVVGKINAKPQQLRWEGRYVNIGAVKPGDMIDVSFPIATRTVTETVGTIRLTMEVRGNTVISVSPRGKIGPLYDRTHYKASAVPWRTVQRYVADKEISW